VDPEHLWRRGWHEAGSFLVRDEGGVGLYSTLRSSTGGSSLLHIGSTSQQGLEVVRYSSRQLYFVKSTSYRILYIQSWLPREYRIDLRLVRVAGANISPSLDQLGRKLIIHTYFLWVAYEGRKIEASKSKPFDWQWKQREKKTVGSRRSDWLGLGVRGWWVTWWKAVL